MISLIVAVSKNGVIGSAGKLPWHLPADLKYFKEATTGSVVVMGRKTFDSIGKPLPNRTNVVLSRTAQSDSDTVEKYKGCYVFDNPEHILKHFSEQDIFIIGGAEVFKLFEPYADRMHITVIDHDFDGDTFLPTKVDGSIWGHMSMTKGVKDHKNPYDYYFNVYYRRPEIL